MTPEKRPLTLTLSLTGVFLRPLIAPNITYELNPASGCDERERRPTQGGDNVETRDMGGRWRLRCGADASRMSGEGRRVQNIGRGHGLTEIGQFQSPEIPPAPPPLPGSLRYDIGGPTCVARKQFAPLSNPGKNRLECVIPGWISCFQGDPECFQKCNGMEWWFGNGPRRC